MSLRARLTLLYTSLVGGILLVFGFVVYQLISVILVEQIDNTLAQTANELITLTHTTSVGEVDISVQDLDLATNVYIQFWERNGVLRFALPNMRGLDEPLDPLGQQVAEPVYRDTFVGKVHIRVLSVPLSIGNRPIGTFQLAASLAIVDITQKNLLVILLAGTVASMGIAAILVSITTYQSLAPLGSVTETALQITRAGDLSQRIPYKGSSEDEIGQLILAFNQTLSRLENLFNTQRRFIADVGHELRTPLTVIKGNVGLMRKLECGDEEALDSIDAEVDRLTRMVGDLLLLARAESGKLPLDRHQVELDTLLLEVLQQTQVLAGNKINLQLGEIDQVLVCGDRDRLKQVLLNLVSNAIKYTQKGGEVIAGLAKVEGQARVTISDNGPGIPAEDLPHIFERFYRTEKSRTRSKDGKGFGLGLSIAYWIVRHHGGHIDVDSKEGQGTRFTVWLPLTEGDCQSEGQQPNKPPAHLTNG
jgi:two-component system OmpR family sensor kinase